MNNRDVRLEILGAGLKYWQIADALGISNSALSVKLRKELPDEEKEKIRSAIAALKESGVQ